MTISPIGATSGSWPIQGAHADSSHDSSAVSSANAQHHDGGGAAAFMQNVMQVLKGLGLNVPTQGQKPQNAPPPPQDGTAPAKNDIGQAVHTFLHDLRDSLRQSEGSQQQSATQGANNHGRHEHASATTGSHQYGNLATDLQNLLSSLNKSDNTGNSSSSDNTQDPLSKLKNDFSDLVSALGGSPTSTPNATLQNFLQQLLTNTNSSSTPQSGGGGSGAGATISTRA